MDLEGVEGMEWYHRSILESCVRGTGGIELSMDRVCTGCWEKYAVRGQGQGWNQISGIEANRIIIGR